VGPDCAHRNAAAQIREAATAILVRASTVVWCRISGNFCPQDVTEKCLWSAASRPSIRAQGVILGWPWTRMRDRRKRLRSDVGPKPWFNQVNLVHRPRMQQFPVAPGGGPALGSRQRHWTWKQKNLIVKPTSKMRMISIAPRLLSRLIARDAPLCVSRAPEQAASKATVLN